MSYPSDGQRSSSPHGPAYGGNAYEPAGGTEVMDDVPAGAPADGVPGEGGRPRKKKRLKKILLISLVVILVLVGGGAVAVWRYVSSVEDKVTKVDAFTGVPEAERPAKPATKAMNILILGSDTRDPELTGSRSDTIMVAHVTADHTSAQIVSIPRDSWVDIPKSADGKHGGVKGKINWSFAWGGIPLMVRAVESVTKVRIDHVVVIDFAGFKEVVDAVGGIEIDNDVTFKSYFSDHMFNKGPIHLNGDLALEYARTRKTLPNGDFDRVHHQQMVVKGVLQKATSAGTIADPLRLSDFLSSVAQTITTDNDFNLLSTATELRGISPGSIRFITNPTKGTGMEGDQSVVYVDFPAMASLFSAVNADQGATWKNPSAPAK